MGGKRKEEEEQFRSRKRKLKEVERKIKKQHIYSVSCRPSCSSCSASFLRSFLFPTKCIRLFCCVFAIYTFIIKKHNTHFDRYKASHLLQARRERRKGRSERREAAACISSSAREEYMHSSFSACIILTQVMSSSPKIGSIL